MANSIKKEKYILYGQFDHHAPFELMLGDVGDSSKVDISIPFDGGTIEFYDLETGKKFKLLCKKT